MSYKEGLKLDCSDAAVNATTLKKLTALKQHQECNVPEFDCKSTRDGKLMNHHNN